MARVLDTDELKLKQDIVKVNNAKVPVVNVNTPVEPSVKLLSNVSVPPAALNVNRLVPIVTPLVDIVPVALIVMLVEEDQVVALDSAIPPEMVSDVADPTMLQVAPVVVID
jgi:hypothetical protein